MDSLDEHIKEFSRQGRFHDIISILKTKIPEVSSQHEKLRLKLQLAEAYYSNRESNKAKKLVEEILPEIRELEDHIPEGNAENLLGKIYRLHQRYEDALIHYQKAEKSFKLTENIEGLTKVYHNLGNVYIFLERFKEAKKFHFKALEIAQQNEKEDAIASSHLNIGSMFYQNGEVDQAVSYFEKARDIFEKIHDESNLAATYLNLAETFMLRNEFKFAQENSFKAADLYEKQLNILGQRLALITLARSLKAAGSLDKAITTFKQVVGLEATEEVLLELGECYLNKNLIEKGKETFEAILELPNRTSHGVGYSLDYLARISIENKEFDETVRIYKQLLKILNTMEPKDQDSIASTIGNLGYMHLKLGNLDQSWEFFLKAADHFKKKKDWDELITLGSNYRNEFVVTGDIDRAITVLKEFIVPAVKKSQNKMTENQYHYEVALLHHVKGKTEEGLHYWKKKHNKKVSFQKYSAPILGASLEEETKSKLEKQHVRFLKKLLTLT